jgi:hypothetical protein
MRAVDPDSFNPDPTFQVYLDPDPIRIQGFDYQKLNLKNTAEHFLIFFMKICNLLMSKLQEKPSALKREHPVLQKMNTHGKI